MPAYDPRQSAHALGHDGVAVVRHGGASLLLFAKRFESLADFAALEMTDLGRDALQRAGHDREGGHELGVAVARYDLRGDTVDPQTELAAHVLLDARVDRGMGANGAADATYASPLSGALES